MEESRVECNNNVCISSVRTFKYKGNTDCFVEEK